MTMQKLKQLTPLQQAYSIAIAAILLQYTVNFFAYFELFPNLLGFSLSGIAKNQAYMIPAILALFGTFIFADSKGLKSLATPYFVLPLNPLWWIFASCCLIPILFFSLYCDDFIYGRPFQWYALTLPTWEDFTYFAPLFVQVAICDELFWIGFIYPRLVKAGYSPLKASLAIGILWGLDYLPYIFTEFLVASGLNAPNLLLGWFSLTPIYIWLYHKTHSALIIVFFNMCMQFLFTAIPILPQATNGSNTGVAMANIWCLVAGLLLWYFFPNGKKTKPVETMQTAAESR